MAREKPPLKEGHVGTLADVARHFNVAYTTVKSSWRQNSMPREPDGTYCLAKIAEWRALRIANQPHIKPMNGTPVTGNLDNDPVHQRRLVELKIKQAELERRQRENDIAAGDYVPRHDVQCFFSALLSRMRDDLARVPKEMSSSFPSDIRDELEEQLQTRLNLCLTTLYRQRSKIEEIAATEAKRSKGKAK